MKNDEETTALTHHDRTATTKEPLPSHTESKNAKKTSTLTSNI
jgi:hypothetical protein